VLRYVLVSREGFGINPRAIYVDQAKCPKGSFCPPGLETKQQFFCPPGRYGSEEGNTNPACNGLCEAGYTCEAGATDKQQKKCPEGFYCLPGTSLLGELRPIPCPAGSFCPEGSAKPTRCAEGIYCPPQTGSGTGALKITQKTTGNNGTVSCQTYCAGTAGKPWNNELPVDWNGADCVETNDPNVGCKEVAGLRPNGIHCTCTPNGKGWVGATTAQLTPPAPPAPPNLQNVQIQWKKDPTIRIYEYFGTTGFKTFTNDKRYNFNWSYQNGVLKSAALRDGYGWEQCLRYDKYTNSATPYLKPVSLKKCGNESPANKQLQEWLYDETSGQIRSAESPELCITYQRNIYYPDDNVYVRQCGPPNTELQQFILKS
jgi:hypothetical protein